MQREGGEACAPSFLIDIVERGEETTELKVFLWVVLSNTRRRLKFVVMVDFQGGISYAIRSGFDSWHKAMVVAKVAKR